MGLIKLTDALVKKFFKNDILDLSTYPIEEIASFYGKKKNKILNLTNISSPQLRQEFKDFLMLILSGFNDKSYKSRIMEEVFHFLPYLEKQQLTSFFDVPCLEFGERYASYRKLKNRDANQLVDNIYLALIEYNDKREGLDRDIWYLDKFQIEENRLNKVTVIKTINFTSINNIESREIVKTYMKYLLGTTELTISTLSNELSVFTHFCNSLGNKNLTCVTADDCKRYFKSIETKSKRSDHYNKYLLRIHALFQYMASKNLYLGENPVDIETKKTNKYNYKYTAIDDFVIFQIFNNLHLLPFDLMVMYVLNYSTGLRVSDICQLEVDKTFTTKGCYFIKHRVQKMQDYQANMIPKAAYELVQEQTAIVKSQNPEAKYLFPAPRDKNRPCSTQYYRNTLGEYIDSWNIKKEDGTQYKFEPHDYRHTISTVLQNDYNVDLAIIQLGVLAHTEINMSLCYAERNQDRRTRFEKNYVGVNGQINSLASEADNQFLATTEWMVQNLELQTLPNGMCAYPLKVGVCPHFDACLICPFFRTSADYLLLHKQQLAQIERDIPRYEANGWLPNLETAKKQRESLIKIINALEK